MSLKRLKRRIWSLSRLLGPRINYSSDSPIYDPIDAWLFEYLYWMQLDYYDLSLDRKAKKIIKDAGVWVIRGF